MDQRWSILLIGLGTVFVSLFGLSLILRLFPFLFAPWKRKPKREFWPVVPAQEVLVLGPDERELVAIITAAIAIQMNLSVGSFRVVSVAVREKQHQSPSWGSVDRGTWSTLTR